MDDDFDREEMRLREEILAAIDHQDPQGLSQELSTEARRNLVVLVRELCTVAKDAGAEHRGNAAMALGMAARGSWAAEIESVLVTLFGDERETVRLAAIRALPKGKSPDVVESLKNAIKDPQPSVVKEALFALQRYDRQVASLAVLEVAELLKHEDAQIQLSACETLGLLKTGAFKAIPRLLEVVVDKQQTFSPPTRQAAAAAIAHIEPNENYIVEAADSLEDVEHLCKVLCGCGTDAAQLFGALTEKTAALTAGPPPGRRRMAPKDIVTYIYGPNPHTVAGEGSDTEAAHRWQDSRSRNVNNWLQAKKLRGLRIGHGVVDVDVGDLESCRQLNHENPAERDQ